jgi:type IV pilus assembly protein PilV
MRMTHSTRIREQSTRGFTLIEVLVALVVLSIGLLGIASLQLSSLRWNHGASLRSQATLLAYDIVDRMRANQIAATGGDYDIAFGTTPTGGTVAGDDKVRWKTVLASTLPGGDGSVARVPIGTTTIFRIIIRWDDSRGVEAPLTFVLETQI